MRDFQEPIIWIIGGTRSSKSHLAYPLAMGGKASLGFNLISTSAYFREKFGQEDTYSRPFVFNLSASAAEQLSQNPECNLDFMKQQLSEMDKPCIIEGERNPSEFTNLYNPKMDMVFFLHRKDMDLYDTTIEPGIDIIEQIVRWNISNGVTPQRSVLKMAFGNNKFEAKYLGQDESLDSAMLDMNLGGRTMINTYPWIGPMVALVRDAIQNYYEVPADLRRQIVTAPVQALP